MKKPLVDRIQYLGTRLSVGAATLVLIVLLAACNIAPRAAPIDRSILTDDPCAAPCWQGIIPGKTTGDEAWSILTELEFLDRPRYPFRGTDAARPLDYIMWRTRAHDDEAKVGDIYIEEGIVSEISVALDFELTLQQVLDKYGTPEKLLSFQWGVEKVTNDIHFYYPQRGLIFVAWSDPVQPGEPGMLESTTPINEVYYFEPTSMDSLFDEIPEYSRRLPFGEEYLQDWHGLGPIEVLH